MRVLVCQRTIQTKLFYHKSLNFFSSRFYNTYILHQVRDSGVEYYNNNEVYHCVRCVHVASII